MGKDPAQDRRWHLCHQELEPSRGAAGKPTLTRDEEGKIIGQVTTNWDFAVAKKIAQDNLTAATAATRARSSSSRRTTAPRARLRRLCR